MAQEFTFSIKGIELLDYSIISPGIPIEPQTPFRFDMNIEHRVNLETKTIFVIVTFNILTQDTDINLGHAKISCIYNAVNLDEFVDKGKITFPNDIIVTLNSISLSTCRGVLFTLFRGTFLHNAILPIVDPKGFAQAPIQE
jgi:hypothetical protein